MAFFVTDTIHPPYWCNIFFDDDLSITGERWGLRKGAPIDPNHAGPNGEALHSSGAIEKKRKKIPDLIGMASIYIISNTLRALIEDMEPDQHQFFPFALRNGLKGPPADEPYFILNITQRANAIVVPEGNYQSGARLMNIHHRDDRVYSVRREQIGGFHLWREDRVINGFFVSDAFLQRFDKAKLKKLERIICEEI